MMEKIWQIEKHNEEVANEAKDPKHWKLKKEDFCRSVVTSFAPSLRSFSCITESLTLISRTLQNDLIVPSWNHFCGIIKEIFEMVSD